jgi:hypothetical protein
MAATKRFSNFSKELIEGSWHFRPRTTGKDDSRPRNISLFGPDEIGFIAFAQGRGSPQLNGTLKYRLTV